MKYIFKYNQIRLKYLININLQSKWTQYTAIYKLHVNKFLIGWIVF